MMDKPAIVPDQQWKDVAHALRQYTPSLLDFLERCEACGLPVFADKADVQADHDFATKFLENFFPD